MDTEVIATSELKRSLEMTDRLSPFINERDKEPTWDGNIYIYSDSSKKKENIKKVPIQIKGKKEQDLSKKTITFSVDTADLKNYLNDGGCIFFVVLIADNGQNCKIYYDSLLPVKLKEYLSEIGNRKAKSINLKEFPSDNIKKEEVLLGFYKNMKLQTSFATSKPLLIQDVLNTNMLQGIKLYSADTISNSFDDILQNKDSDIYLYADIKGSTIPIPLESKPSEIKEKIDRKEKISINDKQYYDSLVVIRSKDNTTVKIGHSFEAVFTETTFNIIYKPTTLLKYIVNDIEFMIDLLKYKYFESNDRKISMCLLAGDYSKEIEQLNDDLIYYKKLTKLLEVLRLNRDIDLSDLDNEDRENSLILIKAFVDKEQVSNLNEDIPWVYSMDFIDKKLMLFFQRTEIPGTYYIKDFFAEKILMFFQHDGEIHKISQFDILSVESILKIANINLDALLPSYQELSDYPYIYKRAMLMMFNLLFAYDKSKDSKAELLDVAEKFAEWLLQLKIDEDIMPYVIRKINYLQVVKRKRDFNDDEKKWIFSVADNINQDNQMRVIAYWLLDEQLAAKTYFDKLCNEEKEQLNRYPGYRFCNIL